MKGCKEQQKFSFRIFSSKSIWQSNFFFLFLHYFYRFKMLWDWRKEKINDDTAFNSLGPNLQLSLITAAQQKLMNP